MSNGLYMWVDSGIFFCVVGCRGLWHRGVGPGQWSGVLGRNVGKVMCDVTLGNPSSLQLHVLV